MPVKWIGTKYPGVRFYEHATRKAGRQPDRYFAIRFRPERGGKQVEEGLGWATEGWTPERAAQVLADLKRAAVQGSGPRTLAEKRTKAQEEHAQALAAQARQNREHARKNACLTDLAQPFLEHVQASTRAATAKMYAALLRTHLIPLIGPEPIRSYSLARLRRLQQSLAERTAQSGPRKGQPLSPTTVEHCLKALRMAINVGQDLGLYDGPNPVVVSRRRGRRGVLRVDNTGSRRLRIFSQAEVEALLEYLQQNASDIADIFLLSLCSGLRLAEACSLTRFQIGEDGASIRLVETKSGDRTIFPGILDLRGQECLKRRLGSVRGDHLFPGVTRAHRRPDNVSRLTGKAIERLGLNAGADDTRHRLTFHSARHTFATRFLEAGGDLYVLKQLLGHEDLSTTEGYLHLANPLLRQQAISRGGLMLPSP